MQPGLIQATVILECGDLSPLCLFSHGIFGKLRGETVNIPVQFQMKSAGQTNVAPRAKLFEKQSGDESPHSKGRLFRD